MACETTEQWEEEFRKAVKVPKPFEVIQMRYPDFMDWAGWLEQTILVKKARLRIQGIRQFRVEVERPGNWLVRRSFEGPWEYHAVQRNPRHFQGALRQAYDKQLDLNPAKLKDLKSLKSYCRTQAGRDLIDSFSPGAA